MKKKKSGLSRLLILFITLALIIGTIPSVFAEDGEEDGISTQAATNSSFNVAQYKLIDYLGDGEVNPDTSVAGVDDYRLYLTASAYQQSEPIDLVLVLDKSGSMEYNIQTGSGDEIQKITALNNILKGSNGFISQVLSANSENNICLINFSSATNVNSYYNWNKDATVLNPSGSSNGWVNASSAGTLSDTIAATEAVLTSDVGGGTDYAAGLYAASNQFVVNDTIKNNGHKKYLVFMSDGMPTFYIGSWSNAETSRKLPTLFSQKADSSDTYIIPATNAQSSNTNMYRYGNGLTNYKSQNISLANLFRASNSLANLGQSLNIYSVAFATNLETAADPGALYTLADSGNYLNGQTSSALTNAFKQILSPNGISDVSINDTLISNVELNTESTDYKVVKTVNGDDTILFENGTLTEAGQSILTGTPTYNESTRTVTLDFLSDYELEENTNYTISFNVKVSDSAKQDFVNSNGAYTNTGDPTTDYGTNTTSSGKAGFFSNTSAWVDYTYKSVEYTDTSYKMPVVQVAAATLTINKQDQNGNALTGSGFTATKDGETDAYATGTSDEKGTITFNKPFLSGSYVITETTVPAGYSQHDDFTVTIDTENTERVATVNDESVNITSDAASANVVLSVKNTQQTGGFTVSKTVAGNTASRNYYFTYKVTLNTAGTYTIAYKDGESDLTNLSEGQPTAITGGTETSIKLKNGQSFSIAGVPVGATYSISEDTVDGYQQSLKKDGTPLTSTTVTGDSIIVDGNPIYAYTNTSNAVVPSALTTNNLPFMLLIAGAGILGLALVIRKRTGKTKSGF